MATTLLNTLKENIKNEGEPQVIFIEGNIGAGKTTLLSEIERSEYFKELFPNKTIKYVYEPVKEWLEYKDTDGIDILTHFYRDQGKFAFSFQWYVFMTRIKAIQVAIDTGADLVFVERSIFTDKNVFMKSLYQKEKITEIEMKMYNDWFDWIANHFLRCHYAFIYLSLPTELAYERIKKRARNAESIIEYDYLDLLNKNHDEWLLGNNKLSDRVLTIPATFNYEVINEIGDVLKLIKGFIGTVFNDED